MNDGLTRLLMRWRVYRGKGKKMNKIRVIKKSEIGTSVNEPKGLQPKVRQRAAGEVIGGWIAEWRERREAETRRLFDEFTRIGSEKSACEA